MKSQERIEKEREKRSMLWFALGFAFILLILVLLMAFGSTGVSYAMNDYFNNIKQNVIDMWDRIMFKLEGFFMFLKNNK